MDLFRPNDWRSHEWKSAIEPHTNPFKALAVFVLGIVLGFFVNFLLGPLFGIVVGGSLVAWAFVIEWKLGSAEDGVLTDGVIAPFIKHKADFHQYLRGVGKERVRAEIEQALEDGHEISPFAQNWYNADKKGKPTISETSPLQRLREVPEKPTEKRSSPTPRQPKESTGPQEEEGDNNGKEEGEEEEDINPFWEIPYAQLVILAGMQGSGKTTTLAAIIEQKLKQQAFVLVCDPFYSAGKHFGLPVVGRDPENRFTDISAAMEWFGQIVEGRLVKQAKFENYDPVADDVHICLVVDEFTNLSNSLDPTVLAKLWDDSLQTLRRLNLSVILATHNLRIPGLGGQKAVASKTEAISNQSMQFKLQTKINRNRQPGESPKIPAGKAKFKREGEDDFYEVKVPEDFKPSNLNFDFRHLTGKEKHPNWRKEVGLENQ